MRRGDIVLVSLDPALGAEADRVQPAVIVSNDGANATAARLGRGVLTVVPVTSKATRVLAFQVALPQEVTGLRADSKAQAEQVRSIAVQRLGRVVGHLGAELMGQLDDAFRLHLAL